jgi:hypothetical protein
MRSFHLKVDERYFNMLWRSLLAREKELMEIVAEHEDDEDSDEAIMAANDVVYVRMSKKSIEKLAREAGFPESAFSVDDTIVDLRELT